MGYCSVAPRRRWRGRPIVVVIRRGRPAVMMRRRPVIIELLARWWGSEAMRRWRRPIEVLPGWGRASIIVGLGHSCCGGKDEQRDAREECTHMISVKHALMDHAGT